MKHIKEKYTLKIETLRVSSKSTGKSEQSKLKNKLKLKIFKVLKSLPGVSRTLLSSILDTKFDPYNLYKLRIIYSDDNNDKTRFSVDTNNELKLEKVKNKLKNFGSISFIWNQAFINYVIVVTIFFQKTHPGLPVAILGFSQRIFELNEIYI